ncbi:MAG: hypothetical protein Q9221_003226 [Calogaya cf. arnoldii]
MYSIILSLLAVWAVCHARPAQDPAIPLDLIKTSSGFPRQYLQSLQNVSGNLDLPIEPHLEPAIHVDVRFARGGIPFRQGSLVMSLAVEAYWQWREESNPMVSGFERRAEVPFQDFVYKGFPGGTIGYPMTPVTLGITYTTMLSEVLIQEIPSGTLYASTRYQAAGGTVKQIGQVEVYNQPNQPSTESPRTPALSEHLEKKFWSNKTFTHTLQPGSGQISNLQITPNEMETRWFSCIREILFFIFQQRKTEQVGLKFHTSLTAPTTYSLNCQKGRRPPVDSLQITFAPTIATLSLTFKTLAEEILVWGAAVTLGQPYGDTAILRDRDGTPIAVLKITIGGVVSGSDGQSKEIDTTA